MYIMVKKITHKRLENITLYYLERYSSSRANLRKVLKRRIAKDVLKGAENPSESVEWIEKIIQRMVDLGYVNDELYKESLINKLKNQGKSTKQIKLKLLEKGLQTDFVTNEDEEYEQALIFIRKKKLGHYRKDKYKEYIKKDMQKMALAGFSYSVIKRILEIEGYEDYD